ncbi:MAG: hypothetical protein U5K74_04370 [Gemmatimonadaceae bacterium]|nr:hypothetical protein [Gemmatimonadaceae bacterium]
MRLGLGAALLPVVVVSVARREASLAAGVWVGVHEGQDRVGRLPRSPAVMP